jgi:TPP-dependent 2-oxoacid decarboxylase
VAGYSSVGDYLIRSLYGRGIKHAFGVPGDYVLSFYDRLTKSNISVINMCDEQGAGFAADAYARIRGLGLVCVTYGVGALKVINTTAQAYAEKSPVIVISGSPGVNEQARNPLLHHKVREFGTQKKIFDEITVASTVLDRPRTAIQEINRVLTQALRFKRPVYIELPRDMVFAQIKSEDQYYDIAEEELLLSGEEIQRQDADPNALQEAIAEASRIISASDRPVVIAGEEIHRFGLQNKLLAFIEKIKIPVAATILSKSVISELHPLFVGIYGGTIGQEKARQVVESSDCIVILGASLSDITLGAFTGQIDPNKLIYVDAEKLSVKFHQYRNIGIREFLDGLTASLNGEGGGNPKLGDHSLVSFARDTNFTNLANATSRMINNRPESSYRGNDNYGEGDDPTDRTTRFSTPKPQQSLPKPTSGKKITIKYLFDYINSCLTDDMIVLADVGDALFAGTDLVIHGKTRFLSPAYYASLGFSVPASVAVQLAEPSLRPLVLVGDGAFQMTGMEVSTVLHYKLNPIVIVLNNGIYLTEELMLKGTFNYLQQWNFSKIPDVIGGGYGFVVQTEDQLVDAFSEALDSKDALCILDIRLGQNDKSQALGRLAQGLAKRFNSHSNESSG